MKNIIICDYAYIEGGATKVAIQTAIALSNYTDYNIYFFAGCGEPCEELKNGIYNRKSGKNWKCQ